ncbi:hypothetical protein Leryth_026257 [Lithospermum erythrorhizon]|nr:hypothetical protein Leryth_026257 [Lithospermum erythrorhizon]
MDSGYKREPDRRYYKVMFHNKYREMITEGYLEHVIKRGREMKARNIHRKLYTNNGHSESLWSHILFEHPATFDTLAMEPWKARRIIEDGSVREKGIDCSLDLTGQRKGKTGTWEENKREDGSSKVTLSGLLNFIDGLWSSYWREKRLIVFHNKSCGQA